MIIFDEIRNDLRSQGFSSDLVSLIVFGSQVCQLNTGFDPIDIDICIVVKNRNADLKKISDYIFSYFGKPDFRIYIEDEIYSKLNFVDVGNGMFAIEYYANGILLYGENIFIDLLNRVDKEKIKQSYLSKIFEYILRIRVAYISKLNIDEYKLWHLNKYVLRMSLDILLYYGYIQYCEIAKFKKEDIFEICRKYGFVSLDRHVDYSNIENLYSLFFEISQRFVELHKNN